MRNGGMGFNGIMNFLCNRGSIQKDLADRITLCNRLTYAVNVNVTKVAACVIGKFGRVGEIGGSFL